MKKQSRRRFIVLTQFQKWFILNFLIYSTSILVVLAACLYYWMKLIVDELLHVGGILGQAHVAIVEEQMSQSLTFIFALLTLLVVLIFVQALYFSRRLAGPIFAFVRHLKRCEEEKSLKPFKLRADDVFQEIAAQFNSLAENLSNTGKN